MPKPATRDAECGGPKFDVPGVISPACIACGKCDAVKRLLAELLPAQTKAQTMRTAANAAR